jgi:hypothetical protein
VTKEKPPGVLPGRAGGQCKGITTMQDILSGSPKPFKEKPDTRAARWLRHGGVAQLQGPAADAWLLRLLRNFDEARLVAVPLLRPHLARLVHAVAGNAAGNKRGGGR